MYGTQASGPCLRLMNGLKPLVAAKLLRTKLDMLKKNLSPPAAPAPFRC